MNGVLEVNGVLTEQQFEMMTRGKGLSNLEREFMRRSLHLPHNEELIHKAGEYTNHAVIAWQKVRGNPLLSQRT